LIQLVHRDVSPSNIIVSYAGDVKLADFGIAKVDSNTDSTRTGTLKGKFGYMAPEQMLQETLDGRADVFALAVVLYELTTGHRAFRGSNAFSVMNKVLSASVRPPQALVPDYPPALARIVERGMALEAE